MKAEYGGQSWMRDETASYMQNQCTCQDLAEPSWADQDFYKKKKKKKEKKRRGGGGGVNEQS